MNRVLKEVIAVYLFFYVNSPALHSQTSNPKFQFGVGAGIFVYQGDLTPSASGSYKTLRPVINLLATKFYSSSFSVRGNVAFGSLKGDDARYEKPEYRQQRNFNFHTPLLEITGIGEWNLLGRNYISKGFAPYVFAGIGYSFLRITRDWSRLN